MPQGIMKTTREPSRRSFRTELVYLRAMRLCLFPGSAVEVAAVASKMGSFHWKFVEYKEQNGFVIAILPWQGPGTT